VISQYQQGLAETRLQSITTCPVVSFLSNTGKKVIRGSDYGSIEVSISVLLEARNQFKGASCVKINNHIQSLGANFKDEQVESAIAALVVFFRLDKVDRA